KEIHSPKGDVAVVSQNDVTWEDSCLGCAKTKEKCTHLLTPGYVITLRVRDATYEYHTDRSGHDVRLCGQAEVTPPPAPVAAPAPAPRPGANGAPKKATPPRTPGGGGPPNFLTSPRL